MREQRHSKPSSEMFSILTRNRVSCTDPKVCFLAGSGLQDSFSNCVLVRVRSDQRETHRLSVTGSG